VDSHDSSADMSAQDAAEMLLAQMSNDANPIADKHRLLQTSDINRLRSIIYRDIVSSRR